MREVIVTQSGHHWCHEMRWVMATVSGRRHGSCGARKKRPSWRTVRPEAKPACAGAGKRRLALMGNARGMCC